MLLPIASSPRCWRRAGVPQKFEHYVTATARPGYRRRSRIGPVASQEAIKLMSGDGGGFFNTNSAHPFENPTGISNASRSC